MANKIQQFLNFLKLGPDGGWSNSIPLKNLWEIKLYNNIIATSSGVRQSISVTNSIRNVLNFYEGPGRGFKSLRDDLFITFGDGTTNGISFFAQGVTLPTDAVTVDYAQTPGMGGLKPGYYSSDREKYTSIDIEFFESNKDIFEYFIRPWMIATAYKGLIEDGDPTTNIKATIDISLYTKQSPTEYLEGGALKLRDWSERKRYRFEGVAPISVPGEQLSYENTFDIKRKASFTFKDYTVVL